MAEYMVITILRISVVAAVMIGVVLLVRAIAGTRIKSGLISALWLMVLLRLLFPVTVGVPFSVNTWLDGVLPKSTVEAAVETSETAETAESPLAFEETVSLPATATETIDAGLATVEKAEPEWVTFFKAHIYHGLLAFWLLGVGVFFAVTGHRMRRFKKHVLKGRFLDIQWLNATVFTYKYWLGVRREIRVMESNLVDVPVVMGVFRPIIILPKGLVATLDREKIKVILLHEICHIKRRDLTKNALWLAAKGVYWFNPLVWVAYKVYLDDAEQACDAMVVGAVNEAGVVVYSEALVAVMRQAKICTVVPAFVSFCKNSSSLRKRVTNMLNPKKKSATISALVMILMLVMAVGCFTTACMNKIERINENNITADTSLDAVQVTAEDTSGQQKEIYVDRVETGEAAIEIAKQFNISGAESFTYKGIKDGVMDVHQVSADDDTETEYSIYDINGEILRISCGINNDNQQTSISKKEAEAKAQEYAKKYYGDVVLTIERCEPDDNIGYLVTGEIYKDSEGSTRRFATQLNGAGEIIFIFAQYDAIYALNIPDEMVNAAKKYAEPGKERIELEEARKENGVLCYTFALTESDTYVTLNAEDASLTLLQKLNISEQGTFDKSREEAEAIGTDFITTYIDDASDINVVNFSSYMGIGELEGTLKKADSEFNFYLSFNKDSELHTLELRPVFGSVKLDIDETEAIAREIVKEDCPYVDTDSLVLIKAYESESENTPDLYMYEFSYTSAKPSVTDFSFEAEVGVNKYSGAFGSSWIKPSTEGIDVLSEKELIEKAKGYIVEAYNADPDELKLREISLVGFGLLEYYLQFDYDEYVSYGCNMIADTGELDGVGESSSVPTGTVEGKTEDQLGYDKVAGIVGDYYDMEITYYNKTAGEEVTYVVDNPFCWVMDSVPWTIAVQEKVVRKDLDYNEYIDILGCHVVKHPKGLVLYYMDDAYYIDTDPKVFDDMVDRIKSK